MSPKAKFLPVSSPFTLRQSVALSPTHQRRGHERLRPLSFLLFNPPLRPPCCPAPSSKGRQKERGRSSAKSLRLTSSHFSVHLSVFFVFTLSWRQSAFLCQSKFTKVVCSGFGFSRCVCGKLMCRGRRSIIGLFPCTNLEISILMTMHWGRGAAAAALTLAVVANLRGTSRREYQSVSRGWPPLS